MTIPINCIPNATRNPLCQHADQPLVGLLGLRFVKLESCLNPILRRAIAKQKKENLDIIKNEIIALIEMVDGKIIEFKSATNELGFSEEELKSSEDHIVDTNPESLNDITKGNLKNILANLNEIPQDAPALDFCAPPDRDENPIAYTYSESLHDNTKDESENIYEPGFLRKNVDELFDEILVEKPNNPGISDKEGLARLNFLRQKLIGKLEKIKDKRGLDPVEFKFLNDFCEGRRDEVKCMRLARDFNPQEKYTFLAPISPYGDSSNIETPDGHSSNIDTKEDNNVFIPVFSSTAVINSTGKARELGEPRDARLKSD